MTVDTVPSFTAHAHVMVLDSRNAGAARLVERIWALTGETKMTAVTLALLERMERSERTPGRSRPADDLDAIARHCAGLPLLDPRSTDGIVGDGANGLPRSGLRRFGKGRHPAALNLGDCFSDALGRAVDEPLRG
jgi:hypothetical protein